MGSRHLILSLICLLMMASYLACSSGKTSHLEISPPLEAQSFAKYTIPQTRPQQHQLDQAIRQLENRPADLELQISTGLLYQALSPPDRWDYLDKAISLLAAVKNKHPKRPEVAMYLGLSQAAKARNPEVGLLNKLGFARKGFGHMDEAVAIDPQNLSFRLLRAKASLLAPSLLGRGPSLKEDLDWIQSELKKEEEVPLHLIAMGYIFLGDHAHRSLANSNLAKTYYQQAMKAGRGTPWEGKALSRLEGRPADF